MKSYFSKTPSVEVPIEDLGPPGVPGNLQVLGILENETRIDEDRVNDRAPREFVVTGLMTKSPPVREGINGDFNENDGSSYLHIPKGSGSLQITARGMQFAVRVNKNGEQALVELKCMAASVLEAKRRFDLAVLPYLDRQSYVANCPIFLTTVKIYDDKNHLTSIGYVSPYRDVTTDPHQFTTETEMAPIYAMYRDAKNSHSDFYKFLCYHKILDGLQGKLRQILRTRARKLNVELLAERDLVPQSEYIASTYSHWIGKSVKKFFDDIMTPQFRNAVAHFITKDGAVLDMSSPQHIARYADILFISELCARSVMERHQGMIDRLTNRPHGA